MIQNQYRVLEINGTRLCRYETLYFDTSDYRLYLQHHNGKMNRYKVRIRRYVDADTRFFEIKLKNNKGRTIKNRIKRSENSSEELNGKTREWLNAKIPGLADRLRPVLWVLYSRITLINKNSPERLTIDIGLHYKNKEKTKSYPELVIAEVKQSKSAVSPFIQIMHQHHIQKKGISKYCFGIICTNNTVKINNFKEKIAYINKYYHDTN
jgi:hypothetical protein